MTNSKIRLWCIFYNTRIEQINIIQKNEEKHITFGFTNQKFVDITSFMNPEDSLDKLAESLRNKDIWYDKIQPK